MSTWTRDQIQPSSLNNRSHQRNQQFQRHRVKGASSTDGDSPRRRLGDAQPPRDQASTSTALRLDGRTERSPQDVDRLFEDSHPGRDGSST